MIQDQQRFLRKESLKLWIISSHSRTLSHYCRKDTDKCYLSPSLSVTKMYFLYLEEHTEKSNAELPVTETSLFTARYSILNTMWHFIGQ